jgi:hypothetical protein
VCESLRWLRSKENGGARVRVRVGFFVSVVALGVLAPIGAPGNVATESVGVQPRWPTSTALRVAQSPSLRPATTAEAVRGVPVHSSYETGTRTVSRDVGVSVALPDGHDLWLFGDTSIFQREGAGGWKGTGFVDGTSALEARYRRGRVPHGGDYPSGVPTRFIPVPTNVYLPDGSGRPCTNQSVAYPARWPTGLAVSASNKSEVLVSYAEVCVTRPRVGGAVPARAEGWGYMLYNWRTHRIDRGPVDVFKPHTNGAQLGDSRIFGSPYFDNHQLTLFASHCTSLSVACARGQVWSVTVPDTIAAMDNPASYKLKRLSIDGSGKWEPISISVGRYAGGFRLIEMTSVGGTYKILSASTVGAPWRLNRSGRLPGCPTHTGFCYALAGHPELSTSTHIFVSYMNPDSGPSGHVVISALPS